MNWDWSDKPRAKRPPPRHGLKVKNLGTTWWGQRWIEALERFSREYLNRLGRGRTYARAGRVHDLQVGLSEVRALVTGSSAAPYKVMLRLEPFSKSAWDAAIAAMGERASFAAELLAGRMPDDIDRVFTAHKRSLFPRNSQDLQTDCSCPDWANPCKHVAAVHYVLGEALDRDPFLLFELRGRSKDQVLQALSRLRSGLSPVHDERAAAVAPQDDASTTVVIAAGEVTDYERPPAALPTLRFSFDAPQPPAAILRSVGTPRAWSIDAPPIDFFGDLYGSVQALAQQLVLATPTDEPEQTDTPATKSTTGPRKK
jgi:uncharacterized Zn finger protein